MDVTRIMLKVRVGHEGCDAVEDRGRREHSQTTRIQRRDRLDGQNYEAVNEQHCVEYQQCRRILLPGLRSAVEAFFKPTEKARWSIFAVHDPSHIPTHRYC